jgi:hypothetical protein
VVRFRRARGIERQQLRWVALAAGLTGVAMGAVAVLIAAGELNLAGWAAVLCLIFLPLATGAARAWWWPGRPWPLPRCSSRPAAASKPRWTGASTGTATTPPARSRPSAAACAGRSTWTR